MGLERLPSTNSCPRDIRFHPHDPYLFTFLSNSKDNETDLYAAKVSQEGDVAVSDIVIGGYVFISHSCM